MYVVKSTRRNHAPIDKAVCKDGFILDENRWDNLPIDDLLYDLNDNTLARSLLERSGYLGGYTLSSDGVCHRTQVAVRTYCMDPQRWNKYVDGIFDEDDVDEKSTNREIEKRIFQPYHKEASLVLEHLVKSAEVSETIKAKLDQRWRQVIEIIQKAQAAG